MMNDWPEGLSKYAVRFWFDGNRYHHEVTLHGVGTDFPTHAHSYDHDTAVVGEIDLVSDDEVTRLSGTEDEPACMVIPAGKPHGFVSRSELSKFTCTHTLREEDGMPLGFDADREAQFQATVRL
jgi:hypothetical protein